VEDALAVEEGEGAADLPDEVEGAPGRERPLALDEVHEAPALQPLERDEREVRALARVEGLHELDRSLAAADLLDPPDHGQLAGVAVAAGRPAEDLEGDRAAEPDVLPGQPHLAVGPRSEEALDGVARDVRSRHGLSLTGSARRRRHGPPATVTIDPVQDSLWFTTRSALFRPGDDAWNEVAAYAEPLGRLLERRYRWLPQADRDDLVQTILIEMKEKLVERHDRTRGRFRALLQAVVKRRIADALRRRRAEPLDEARADSLAAPDDSAVEALDLETGLVEAVAACRDRFTQGKDADPDVLYALADRIVHGLSNVEIARKDGVSVDRVARLLRRGRDAVFAHLLRRETGLDEADRRFKRALELFKEFLRRPAEATRLVADLPEDDLREELTSFLARFSAALPHFEGAADDEFQRGLELVLAEDR